MSDVVNLSTVNLDILLEVVKHGLGVRDLLSLRATSKSLYNFTSRRAPWIVLLNRLSRTRALPLPPYRKLGSFSVEDLIAIAMKTDNITENWASLTPEPRPAYRMVAFPPTDIIVSILVIPHTPYVLTLSVGGGVRAISWITCVDTDKGRRLARYRSEGLVSSWRAETIAEKVIVIALLIGPEDRSRISPELPAHYNVLRLDLPSTRTHPQAAFHGISSHLITSPITGMFLTTEVAGLVSVIRGSQTSGLLMTRFKDATTAYIDTGVPVTKATNLNTIANQADLILYTEDNRGASAYAYSFADDLFPLFAPSPPHAPQRLVRLPPTTIQNYRFHPSELCDGSNIAYTIIRTRWKDLAAARLPPGKPGHSEISVLSMAFVLGADESGAHDHRCISHMYLDPFHPQDAHDEAESVTCCSCSCSTTPSGSDRGTPEIVMHPQLTPSSALATQTPSPTVVSQSLSDDEHPKKTDSDPIIRRTFHSCLEEKKEIWQGPSRNDLISVGLAASHAIWLAAGEHRETPPVLKLASFEEPPMSLPLRAPAPATETATVEMEDGTQLHRAAPNAPPHVGPRPPRAIRTLKLPLSIHPHEISALALDDANGVIALATTRSELWLLDYAISPATLRVPEYA